MGIVGVKARIAGRSLRYSQDEATQTSAIPATGLAIRKYQSFPSID